MSLLSRFLLSGLFNLSLTKKTFLCFSLFLSFDVSSSLPPIPPLFLRSWILFLSFQDLFSFPGPPFGFFSLIPHPNTTATLLFSTPFPLFLSLGVVRFMAQDIFFKMCICYGAKLPSCDSHAFCLFCLGESHKVDTCPHCAHFTRRLGIIMRSIFTSVS